MHNLLGKYKPDRKWDLIVAPRAGGWWDNYADKGCPILGVGIINTYRLSNNKKQTKQPLFAEVNLTEDEFRQSPSTNCFLNFWKTSTESTLIYKLR